MNANLVLIRFFIFIREILCIKVWYCFQEESVLDTTEDTIYQPSTKSKVIGLAPPEEIPKNFADYLK